MLANLCAARQSVTERVKGCKYVQLHECEKQRVKRAIVYLKGEIGTESQEKTTAALVSMGE